DDAEIDVRPGGLGVLTFTLRATNRRATLPIAVEALDPPHRFAFRWMHPAGAVARPGNSVLGEFVLAPEGTATRLAIVWSGLVAVEWRERETTTSAAQQGTGGARHLPHLRDYAARRAGTAGSR